MIRSSLKGIILTVGGREFCAIQRFFIQVILLFILTGGVKDVFDMFCPQQMAFFRFHIFIFFSLLWLWLKQLLPLRLSKYLTKHPLGIWKIWSGPLLHARHTCEEAMNRSIISATTGDSGKKYLSIMVIVDAVNYVHIDMEQLIHVLF